MLTQNSSILTLFMSLVWSHENHSHISLMFSLKRTLVYIKQIFWLCNVWDKVQAVYLITMSQLIHFKPQHQSSNDWLYGKQSWNKAPIIILKDLTNAQLCHL